MLEQLANANNFLALGQDNIPGETQDCGISAFCQGVTGHGQGAAMMLEHAL